MNHEHLARIDKRAIAARPDEVRLFLVARNETLRLPYFLDYYTQRGVDRMFVVDNNSHDGTPELLLERPNVHVFSTCQGHHEGQSGRLWLLPLLARFGLGHWCVIVDADELLAYPNWEQLSIRDVCTFFDGIGAEALYCCLLDMYSECAVARAAYTPGADPFGVCPYFDIEYEQVIGTFHDRSTGQSYPINTHIGGMRRRIFGIDPYCSKVPLVKYKKDIILARGWHNTIGARQSPLQGVVFHFKYFHDFSERCMREAERPARINVAHEYRAYADEVRRNPNLTLHYSGSERFHNSQQLVDLDIMRSTPSFDRFASRLR
jgi:hypothetical protein